MVKDRRAPNNPFAGMVGVANADADAKRERRALTADELRWLLKATASEISRFGMLAVEHARLYRFAFETGLRPGQIRSLTVSSFDLDALPPTVEAAARFVKRRKRHVQVLGDSMATELREAFSSQLPTAKAFGLPRPERIVKMFRRDLDAARAMWIKEAGDVGEKAERMKSDFLSQKDHAGLNCVFYSLRHGHGTALAEAGISQKDISGLPHG